MLDLAGSGKYRIYYLNKQLSQFAFIQVRANPFILESYEYVEVMPMDLSLLGQEYFLGCKKLFLPDISQAKAEKYMHRTDRALKRMGFEFVEFEELLNTATDGEVVITPEDDPDEILYLQSEKRSDEQAMINLYGQYMDIYCYNRTTRFYDVERLIYRGMGTGRQLLNKFLYQNSFRPVQDEWAEEIEASLLRRSTSKRYFDNLINFILEMSGEDGSLFDMLLSLPYSKLLSPESCILLPQTIDVHEDYNPFTYHKRFTGNHLVIIDGDLNVDGDISSDASGTLIVSGRICCENMLLRNYRVYASKGVYAKQNIHLNQLPSVVQCDLNSKQLVTEESADSEAYKSYQSMGCTIIPPSQLVSPAPALTQ